MIIYGVATGASIGGALHRRGRARGSHGPGLDGALLRRESAPRIQRVPFPAAREAWRTFREAILTLLMPVIIVGGILGRGVHAPPKAAAVAVFL